MDSSILDNFPKQRPPLPDEIAAIYHQQYQSNRQGDSTAASLAQRVESWLHKKVAADVKDHNQPPSTLELGAGTLNQLPWEPTNDQYDIVEPFHQLFESKKQLKQVRHVYQDINQIPLKNHYQRITSVAVLEHVCNLPELIARCGILLESDGVFRASIPNEGSMLWALGWKLTTGLEFRLKHGLDYGLLMRHEHVNNAKEIAAVLRLFFSEVKLEYYGLSQTFSLYHYLECRQPKLDFCRRFLNIEI